MSVCGKGISMPAPRSASFTAMPSSLLIRGVDLDAATRRAAGSASALSPKPVKNADGLGKRQHLSRARAPAATSRTRSPCSGRSRRPTPIVDVDAPLAVREGPVHERAPRSGSRWARSRPRPRRCASCSSGCRSAAPRPRARPTSIVSPVCTGRSNSRISPDTKLFTTFCRPKPMPTPNAPASSVKRDKSMPAAPIASRKPSDQDHVVHAGRDRGGHAARQRDARQHVLVQHEAQEAREREGEPERDEEGERGRRARSRRCRARASRRAPR